MIRVPTISWYLVVRMQHMVVIWNRPDVSDESLIEYFTFEKHWQPVLATNAHVPIPSSIVQVLYQWFHSTLLSECNSFWFFETALMHLIASASQSLYWRWTRHMSLLEQARAPAIFTSNAGCTRIIAIPHSSRIRFGGDFEPPWWHWLYPLNDWNGIIHFWKVVVASLFSRWIGYMCWPVYAQTHVVLH